MTTTVFEALRNRDVSAWRRMLSEAIAAGGILRTYPRKSAIFNQGAEVDAVYAVKSGLIETNGLNPAGREVTLSIRGPGESFGYSEPILGRARTRQATALLDAEIWCMDSDAFLTTLSERPELILAMLGSALDRITQSSEMRADLRGTSARSRVGYVLSRLAGSTDELAGSREPLLPITHEEMSRICDISRQTVTKTLGLMRREGILELGLRSIRILDRERLFRLESTD